MPISRAELAARLIHRKFGFVGGHSPFQNRPLLASNAEFIGGGGLLTHIRIVPGRPRHSSPPRDGLSHPPQLGPFLWSTAGQYRSGALACFDPKWPVSLVSTKGT